MVSIIIPVYNAATTIEECLRSVINQSYEDLEIVVVDDGSTDDTYDICERVASEDSRIRLIKQRNAGVSAARNKGISVSRGQYIAFVDSDDRLLKEGIATMIAAMECDKDLVIGSHETFRPGFSKSIVREKREFSAETLREEFALVDGLMNTVWGKLYRRDLIEQHNCSFNDQLRYSEDHVFNLEYCKQIRNAIVIPNMVYSYRLGGLASSLKYHPDWNRFCMLQMKAYEAFFDGENKLPPEFFKKKANTQIIASIIHYMVHCSGKDVEQKIAETLMVFAPYINEEFINEQYFSPQEVRTILSGDSRGLRRAVFSKYAKQIVIRKAKIACYRWFKKRI